MITCDHGGAQQWLAAKSAHLAAFCVMTKHRLARESHTDEGTKLTRADTEEGKVVEMERGGDGWKR